ncbi:MULTISPECIES: hypothetical protein [unclassified Nocardiopsis]|uniref:hypothetical protein n=1 Tax=unclassified Nocardiopsis TaxID=2649073 RepID=UPI000ACF603A|nr:hypothetical protein [Nocardiopsis sp. TSRI0078]
MPKMLTVDEEFEAIVADAAPEAKIRPFQEPDPTKSAPAEEQPAQDAPVEEKPAQEE